MTSALLALAAAGAVAAPAPIVDTEPPTNITLHDATDAVITAPLTFHTSRPAITLDMVDDIVKKVVVTDATSATSSSSDIPGYPTGHVGPLPPGRHTITWTVADSGNNKLSTDQIIDVLPEVNFALDQTVGEGNNSVTVTAYLSGPAPIYPVTLPYTISGTATGGSDHTAVNGSIVIAAPGTAGSATFEATADATNGEPAETVIFTLTTGALESDRVIAGGKVAHTVTIIEDNLAPITTITAKQAANATTFTRNITRNGGLVTLTATSYDPDGDLIASYDWSASDNALIPMEGTTKEDFIFDPASLAPGVYTARLTVRDDNPGNSAISTREILLRLHQTRPVLSFTEDSDDDGIVDDVDRTIDSDNDGTPDYIENNLIVEGIEDDDGDGIPNYLDAVSNRAWLPGWELLTYLGDLKRKDSFVNGPVTFTWELNGAASNRTYYPLLLATEAGLDLNVGPTAFTSGSNHGRISTAAVSLHFGSPLPSGQISADGHAVDVEIAGLGTSGQSVYLVIPQAALLPSASTFTVIGKNHTWERFSTVSGDAIYRAAKSPDNYCPPPGSSDYVINDASDDSELPAGIECIALKISDGGPNDYDGLANGIIHLLGAPLVEAGNGGNTITLPEPYDGTIKRKEESLDKLALTDGGGGIGQIGMFGVAGLLLAFALRRRPR